MAVSYIVPGHKNLYAVAQYDGVLGNGIYDDEFLEERAEFR